MLTSNALRLAGADMIIVVDVNNARKQWGERFWKTHSVNPRRSALISSLTSSDMTRQGAQASSRARSLRGHSGTPGCSRPTARNAIQHRRPAA